ncbi:MAG: N-acetylglucosaminyl-diphospho-decaprenol L-rhamnosyltransferase, partial [Pseudomonadota bacterium]
GSCLGYGRGDDPSRPEYAYVRDVDYCSGAFLMVRRSLFEALGRLDTAFVPAYYEESDFCVRLWEAGHRIVYDPQVRIRHFEFASEVASGWAIELQRQHRDLFVQRHPAFLAERPEPAPAAIVRARARLAPGRQRVLVIDDRVPLPWLGQGYPRAAHLVQVLAGAGHAVTHYPLQFPHEDRVDVARALPETVEVMLGHGVDGLLPFLQARARLYDTVIVSRPHNMQALQRLLLQHPGLLDGTRVVYDAEAMFSLRDIARAELDGRPLPAAECRQRIADELTLARGAQAVLAVSEPEAAHYREAGFDPVHVLGHELVVADGTPGFEARSDLLFMGAMTADDTPNADSLRWFVGEVWPQVAAALGPDVQLHLVGACEAPSVRALAGPRIQVHGRVDALDAVLDRARVFIVPTRYAAGIPHKAHEAAARGLPMVVTPLIARQLGWQDFVATGADAASFAQQCVALHRDAQAWQRQRQAVLAAVRRDCSAAAFRQALDRALGLEAPPEAHVEPPPPIELPSVELSSDDQRTADLWGRDAVQRADTARQRRHWSSHPVTAAEINRLVSGDVHVGWVDHLQRSRFPAPRARGLSLGCGSGAVVVDALRLGIVQTMEGIDISAGAVQVAQQRAEQAGLAQRARFSAANVNELPLQGPYDLIVFEQSLHHVDALGPVLDRCHDALAPDGLLVVNEYVGPDRFQWSDEAERLMNAMLALLPESHRRDPENGALKSVMQRVDPQAVIALDPSEAIHSGDILPALAARFECLELRPFGGTLLQFLLADIASNFDPDEARDVTLLRMMTLMETELIRCGAVASDFVYGVYRRRGAA